MNAREYRHKVEFRAYRDVGFEASNSRRELSEPITCYAKITPRSVMRVVDDRVGFGTEKAVTHILETRFRDDLDVFVYVFWNGQLFKIIEQQVSDDLRSISIGIASQGKANKSDVTAGTFNV